MPSILPPRLKPQSPEASFSTPSGHFWLLGVRREGISGCWRYAERAVMVGPSQPNPPCRRTPANQRCPVGGLAETCGWRAFEESDLAAYGLDLPGAGRVGDTVLVELHPVGGSAGRAAAGGGQDLGGHRAEVTERLVAVGTPAEVDLRDRVGTEQPVGVDERGQ